MTDKKTFGTFIRIKRMEKNYSQKDLAELLFVTEGAVSKWERGVSYPDITLITDLCRVLDISEHELITASTDTETRKMKHEARSFRVIRGAWFWTPTIAYAVALLTCFICNLAVNHTLSWFFIVLASLICAYTFIPTITGFFESKKLLAFCISTYLSICLLLFTCAVYTGGMSWLLTTCIGILIGYVLLFVPILLSKSKLSRYKFLISFAASYMLTVLLILNVSLWHPFDLTSAIWMTSYSFMPAVFCAIVCTLRFDAFLKAGLCTAFSAVVFYFVELVAGSLFGAVENSYQVNFNDWGRCLEGNIYLIILTTSLLISAIFVVIGIIRSCKKNE